MAPLRHNVPAHLPTLIGREEALATVRELVLRADAGLVTLTGAGGSGKTHLALALALSLLDAFADGVWLAELAALADPALVAGAVMAAIGMRETPGRAARDTLVEAVRRRSILLVLDNCEHLVEACASLVEELLRSCPNLRILATSREPLRLNGERTWRVPTLPAPDPHNLPALKELSDYAAVRLFVDRAQALQPSFSLNERNGHAVAGICARVDGLPLAIELAAARVRVLTAEQILDRLDDALALLVGGTRTAHTRQQTLRATLEWSVRLLAADEERLFVRLAVFAGGFDLQAAEAVGAGSGLANTSVLDLLTRLVDKSLVLADESVGAQRYRMLEPVRQYAQTRLAVSPDRATVERRHAERYLALAERAEPELTRPDQVEWLDRLERDHDNLRAALRWGLTSSDTAEIAMRLAAALGRFWWVHSHYREMRQWLERTAQVEGPASGRARALGWLGLVMFFMPDSEDDPAHGSAILSEALEFGRQAHDEPITAWLLMLCSQFIKSSGDMERSLLTLKQGLFVSRAVDEPWLIGLGLAFLGQHHHTSGEYDQAMVAYQECLDVSRRGGEPWTIAAALSSLGQLAHAARDPRAETLLREGLELAHSLGDARRMVTCLEGLAGVYADVRPPTRSVRLFAATHAWREMTGAVMEPAERAGYARNLARLRPSMEPRVFEAAWRVGLNLSLEQAIELAFATERPATPSPDPVQILTPREREVAALVARGLTNRQMAEQLVISERTADGHVANILSKLALNARAQIAVWAVEHQLVLPMAVHAEREQ